MRTVSIVGARPQFVKLAPVHRAMADASATGGIEDIIVHTGQHYDPGMSDVFFDELEIPRADIHLKIGSGSHGAQTARMLESIESVLVESAPDMVVIYGDTNSTVAGALAAAKMHIPIAHVEAGLRSFNREMPEEINRVVADHVSDLLLAPTQTGMKNLRAEGLEARSVLTGDVMLDAVMFNLAIAEKQSDILARLGIEGTDFAVATLHRASNTEPEPLRNLLDTFNRIATEQIPIVFPVHPRTVAVLKQSGSDWEAADRLHTIEPVGYLDMLKLVRHASVVLTDSGGLQKEALFVETPCVTLRDETEWLETVDVGGNVVTGTDPERIVGAVDDWLQSGFPDGGAADEKPFGDGHAAEAIVSEILRFA